MISVGRASERASIDWRCKGVARALIVRFGRSACGVELGASWARAGRGVSEAAEAWEGVMRLLGAVSARAKARDAW